MYSGQPAASLVNGQGNMQIVKHGGDILKIL